MDNSSNDTPPPSPTHRRRPPLRLEPIGIPTKTLVGKVITSIRRSPTHPALTLHCSDGSSFQVRIDGYNPTYPGVPKTLEMDPSLLSIFNTQGLLSGLTIVDCVSITLMDKAHDTRVEPEGPRHERWDQHHIGVAFKFLEDATGDGSGKGWHCIWATLAEYDEERGQGERACVFRSYDDVYLETLQRSPQHSPRKRGPRKKSSRSGLE